VGAIHVQRGDWSIAQLNPPVGEPLTLAQAKLHLRIDDSLTEDDVYVTDLISAARGELEDEYGIRFLQQQVEVRLQNFPRADRIKLPIWPVQTIDYFRYHVADGTVGTMDVVTDDTQAISGSAVLTRVSKKPAEVMLPFAHVWPAVILQAADGIRIGLTVGYLTGGSPETLPIPPAALMAMRRLISHGYENRDNVTLGTLMKSDEIAFGVSRLMANVGLYW